MSQIESREITSRAEWLSWRMQDISASDVPAVCGIDPYRSPLKVWAEKTGAIAGTTDGPTLKRGRWLEAATIEALREERPTWDVRRAGVYLRDPAIRLGATPDAVAVDPEREGIGAVQCKSVRRDIFERDWIVTDPERNIAIAPSHYQVQTLTEAMLAGAAWGTVAAIVIDAGGGAEFYEAPIDRHEAAEARIRTAVIRFWSDLEAGRVPAVQIAQDADVVDALYPRAEASEPVDLSKDNLLPVWLAERERLKAEIKAAEARVSEIDTHIKAKLGAHEAGALPGWKITWKTQRRAECVIPAWEGRVLRISEVKPRKAAP